MKHLIRAVFTITMFTILDRVLGFVFKIYLSRELGGAGIGVYQVALSVFFLLLTVTTSGLPLVVSKLTAKYRAARNRNAENGTISAALIIGIVSGIVVCGFVLALYSPLKNMFASSESMTILLLLLPGVAFSGIYAAFRGNLWGKEKYMAVSIIEVIEQIVRILLCVILFLIGFNKLKTTALSLSIACGFTMIACAICYFKDKGKLASPKGYIKPLLKSSVPITIVRASSSIVNSLIAIVVPFLLTLQGNTTQQAMHIFGSSIGMALPLLYIPITVVGSLAYVMIPTLSSAYAKKDKASMIKQVETALIFSIVVASIFVPSFWALGEPLGMFIYNNADSGQFITSSAWLLIPLSIESIASSMLNSLDLEVKGFINYLIGALALFGIMFAFTKSFNINILTIGLGVSWTISSILDIISIKKRTGISLKFFFPLSISIGLIFPATFVTKTVYILLSFMPDALSLSISGLIGIVFMFSLSLVFGIIDLSYFRQRKKNRKKAGKMIAIKG